MSPRTWSSPAPRWALPLIGLLGALCLVPAGPAQGQAAPEPAAPPPAPPPAPPAPPAPSAPPAPPEAGADEPPPPGGAEDLFNETLDLAEVRESGRVQKMLADMGNLRLDETARWVDNTLIEDGVCRAVFKKGIVVPVLSGRKEVRPRVVGFVFFGEGDVEMRFPEKADAIGFGNHMVMQAGAKAPDLRPVAHGEQPFHNKFTRAMVLTADRQMADLVLRLDPVRSGAVRVDISDPALRGVMEEFVVKDTKGDLKARIEAANVFPARSAALSQAGLDPVDMLQYDRMVHDLLATPWHELRFVAEFQTETRFFVANRDENRAAPEDKWLTCFRDGADLSDTGRRATAFAHGINPRNGQRDLVRFSTERFAAMAPTEAPRPPTRIEAVRAEVKVDARPTRRRLAIRPLVSGKLTLRATEDGVQHFTLRLPSDDTHKGSFKVTKLELADGRPVDWMKLELEQGRSTDLAQRIQMASGVDASTQYTNLDSTFGQASVKLGEAMGPPTDLLIVLPTPLKRGETVDIALDWTAEWPYANFAVVQGSSGNAYRPLGTTTGPRRVLPELLPVAGGTSWDFEITVGVPPRAMDVAVSGDTRREWVDEGGWLWQRSHGYDARQASVALGKWQTKFDPAAAGLPAVRVHMFPNDAWSLQQFGPETRRVLTFLRRFMRLPDQFELDVFQDAADITTSRFIEGNEVARAGMVGINRVKVGDQVGGASTELREENPFLAQSELARQLTTQLWGQQLTPASKADRWMLGAVSSAYGMFYVRAAQGEPGFEAFENRLEYIRKSLENPQVRVESTGKIPIEGSFISLTGRGNYQAERPKVFEDYAFYVLARMLRERVGDQAFFRALDRFTDTHNGGLISTELLEEAFEETSGQVLDSFFDYWVHGGFVPKVRLEYALEPEEGGTYLLRGCIITDIPFGELDLPVGIYDNKAEKDGAQRKVGGMMKVVDGRGAFAVSGRSADAEAEADPFGLILSYSRTARKVDQTLCTREGGDRWATIIEDKGPDEVEERKRRRREAPDYDRSGPAEGAAPAPDAPTPAEEGGKRKKGKKDKGAEG
ncbi:MAG: hypothetical protein JNM72_20305 [Deltaproteobacteria bacterium]|nr:hypothetical protein [Deltaproteobacteria bacterium]